MSRLESEFTRIRFSNPFLLSSSPATVNARMVKKAFAAGWGGVVLKTIGLEPTPNPCPRLQILKEGHHKTGMVNIELISDLRLAQWGDELKQIRDRYPEKPVIASIMGGGSPQDWQSVIHILEPLGVSGFEIMMTCPVPSKTGKMEEHGHDPESMREVVSWVRSMTKLPVWVKLSPNTADIASMARAAKAAGADAVVATDTLSGLGGIDLETFTPLPAVGEVGIFGGYSGPGLKAVSLRCAAAIASSVEIPLAGCGGISSWRDAAEFMAVGASVVQVCTAVMWNGYGIISQLTEGLEQYLEQHHFAGIGDLTGKALPRLGGYADIDLSLRKLAVVDASQCNGCGRCQTACDSGGFEAITLSGKLAGVDPDRCDGCGLCVGICPSGALSLMPVG
jgi:dihydropyrimidine dehydrogenase (NAD+) subunit PreA